MKNLGVLAGALAAAVALPGCQSKIDSTVTVNTVPFRPTSCRNGAVYGFTGVELTGANTSRIRLMGTPTGQSMAYYLMPGTLAPLDLGYCGPLRITQESSRINGVYNIEGTASLNCRMTGLTLAGDVTFHNCH